MLQKERNYLFLRLGRKKKQPKNLRFFWLTSILNTTENQFVTSTKITIKIGVFFAIFTQKQNTHQKSSQTFNGYPNKKYIFYT